MLFVFALNSVPNAMNEFYDKIGSKMEFSLAFGFAGANSSILVTITVVHHNNRSRSHSTNLQWSHSLSPHFRLSLYASPHCNMLTRFQCVRLHATIITD